ncbi:asparagine synthase (glutamine-hydrolyzing) [Gammaproteobacteria bacterium]|nr:asparagine synthase (glutamine-hydrolyzing) [Gammaproteobacteria bacterium]
MCGFTGFISANNNQHLEYADVITSMSNSLEHRGPDGSGVWVDASLGICLGHRRLAVLDISDAGKQPMISSDGRYILAFNGEIYNHLTIRKLLEAENNFNVCWQGSSDTETLLGAITHWGFAKTLEMLVGMFAFSLWDQQTKIMFLARDRLGEKPLYWGWVNNSFVFASELKAIKAYPSFNNSIDRNALKQYLRFNYVPSPLSIYHDISKLEAGHYLQFDYNDLDERKIRIVPYWSLSQTILQSKDNKIHDHKEGLIAVKDQLQQSIGQQMLSDVPLGAFLSGGIDSSLIVALMQEQSSSQIKTFTIGFDDTHFDESPHARAVAQHLNTDHTELLVTSRDALDLIPQLPTIYDEPFADSSQIPTYFVCKAAKSSVTVALSGDAGDEIFGGYNRYFWGPRIWSKISWLPYKGRQILGNSLKTLSVDQWNKIGFVMNKLIAGSGGIASLGDKIHKLSARLESVNTFDELYLSLVTEWKDPSSLVKETIYSPDDIILSIHDMPASEIDFEGQASAMMYLDTLSYLPDDILCKVDRAAMANSLETRSPFLDHRLIELAWRLPESMKLNNKIGKLPLRKILDEYVPSKLIDRPKAGFGIPVGDWLRGPLKSWAEELLDSSRLDAEGYFQSQPITEIWQQHLSGRHDWTPKLWSILMFQAWLENQ